MPIGDGRHYRSQGIPSSPNESNEPVFDAHLLVGAGLPAVTRALAALETTPVLPVRSKRMFMGRFTWLVGSSGSLSAFLRLLLQALTSLPQGEACLRWASEGDRFNNRRHSSRWAEEHQFGGKNFFMPIWVAMTFLNVCSEMEASLQLLWL